MTHVSIHLIYPLIKATKLLLSSVHFVKKCLTLCAAIWGCICISSISFQAYGQNHIGTTNTTDSVSSLDLSFPLKDIPKASQAIQKAAQAVFKIKDGTASFIRYKHRTLVMTNNHVAGLGHCARSGCFVKVTLDYSRKQTATYYYMELLPVVARDDVDVAFYTFQLWDRTWQKVAFKPPHVLKFARSLSFKPSQNIYLIGHPRGSLKKFSQGETLQLRHGHMMIDAFSLPGSSGSPILDTKGDVIGIHHSSIKRNDMFTAKQDIIYQGRGSTAQSIISVLKTAHRLPKHQKRQFFNTQNSVTFQRAKQLTAIYQHSRTLPKLLSNTSYFKELYKDCSKSLKHKAIHRKAFHKSHSSCSVAKKWLRCSKHHHLSSSPSSALLYHCPESSKDRNKWAQLFENIATNYQRFVGEDPHEWDIEALHLLIAPNSHHNKNLFKTLTAALKKDLQQNPTNWDSLLRFAKIYLNLHHNGHLQNVSQNIFMPFLAKTKQQLKTYNQNKHYRFHIPTIAQTAYHLWLADALSNPAFNKVLTALRTDTHLTLFAMLNLDKIHYETQQQHKKELAQLIIPALPLSSPSVFSSFFQQDP
ncbi:MAG: serine protease [Proteobacteria bacterium]|nr:serine protease [Pseudomonadota bacterium]